MYLWYKIKFDWWILIRFDREQIYVDKMAEEEED
jgi:hypothetical protein